MSAVSDKSFNQKKEKKKINHQTLTRKTALKVAQVSLDLKVKWEGEKDEVEPEQQFSISLQPWLSLPLTLTYEVNRCLLEWKMRSTGGSGILEDHHNFYQQQKNMFAN